MKSKSVDPETILNFGKHKGQTFIYVYENDSNYVNWAKSIPNPKGELIDFLNFVSNHEMCNNLNNEDKYSGYKQTNSNKYNKTQVLYDQNPSTPKSSGLESNSIYWKNENTFSKTDSYNKRNKIYDNPTPGDVSFFNDIDYKEEKLKLSPSLRHILDELEDGIIGPGPDGTIKIEGIVALVLFSEDEFYLSYSKNENNMGWWTPNIPSDISSIVSKLGLTTYNRMLGRSKCVTYKAEDYSTVLKALRAGIQNKNNIEPVPNFILRTFPEFFSFSRESEVEDKTRQVLEGSQDYYTMTNMNNMQNIIGDILWDKLMPFQRDGVLFGLGRNGRVLIGDEMGLGKTLQALAISAFYIEDWPLLIICPSSIRFQWLEQCLTWLPHLVNENEILMVKTSKQLESSVVNESPKGTSKKKRKGKNKQTNLLTNCLDIESKKNNNKMFEFNFNNVKNEKKYDYNNDYKIKVENNDMENEEYNYTPNRDDRHMDNNNMSLDNRVKKEDEEEFDMDYDNIDNDYDDAAVDDFVDNNDYEDDFYYTSNRRMENIYTFTPDKIKNNIREYNNRDNRMYNKIKGEQNKDRYSNKNSDKNKSNNNDQDSENNNRYKSEENKNDKDKDNKKEDKLDKDNKDNSTGKDEIDKRKNNQFELYLGCYKIVIVSYDILVRMKELDGFKAVICDESHYLKSRSSQRSRRIVPMLKEAKRTVLLSGTPAVNFPAELYQQLSSIIPAFSCYSVFVERYCKKKFNIFSKKMEYADSKHAHELHLFLVKTVMIRRLKYEVMKELPSKIRSKIPIEVSDKVVKMTSMMQDQYREFVIGSINGDTGKGELGKKGIDGKGPQTNLDNFVVKKDGVEEGLEFIGDQKIEGNLFEEEKNKDMDSKDGKDVDPDLEAIRKEIFDKFGNEWEVKLKRKGYNRDNKNNKYNRDTNKDNKEDSNNNKYDNKEKNNKKEDKEDKNIYIENNIEEHAEEEMTEIPKMQKLFFMTGEAKIKGVCKYIEEILENNDKFIIFAHHIFMLDAIEETLKAKKVTYIRIDGSTKFNARAKMVQDFQRSTKKEENGYNDINTYTPDKTKNNIREYNNRGYGLEKEDKDNKEIRVALLSITACGVGLNLTACSTVIFAELFWVPGKLLQAEDRVHRIGTEFRSINIHYLIAQNSIDELIWKVVNNKQMSLTATLDGAVRSIPISGSNKKNRW